MMIIIIIISNDEYEDLVLAPSLEFSLNFSALGLNKIWADTRQGGLH